MSEEIERWVAYMKAHPDSWKRLHTEFIDAQFDKSYAFMERLLKTPGGKEKLLKAYNITHEKGFEGLFTS